MSDATIFYILGGALAAIAVLVSFAGLRFRSFPGRFAPVVFLCILLLAGTAITFAVRNGQHEEKARAAENKAAGEEIEEEEENPAVGHEEGENAGSGTSEAEEEPGAAAGKGSTVSLEAADTAIAYEQKSLSAKAGNVTIDFTNPSALEHDVAIEGEGGEEIAVSKVIAESNTTVSAELKPGKYTFFCTIPGHREAGMEGTLTVK